MGSEEVIVGNKEGSQSDSPLGRIKPTSGSGMELVGAYKAFDKLFKGSEFFRFRVKVLKTDNLLMNQRRGSR